MSSIARTVIAATLNTWRPRSLLTPFLLRDRYRREMRDYLGVPEREDLTLRLWIEIIEETRHLR